MRQHLYEHVKQKLASRQHYVRRVIRRALEAFFLLLFVLLIGMLGYHFLGDLSWVDAFLNASMIMGGMGPVDFFRQDQSAAKIFSGIYAILCGVFFLFAMAYVLAPVLHRFLHKLHLDSRDRN
jgi:hypothetical protein